jgi:uncharacterized SAM-binding protein YcdF (DUF218 family)
VAVGWVELTTIGFAAMLFFGLLCLLVAVACFWRDPRMLRIGVFGLAGVGLLVLDGFITILASIHSTEDMAWVVLGSVAIVCVAVIVLAVTLMLNGLVMIRREGRRLPNLLSGLLGVAIAGYVGLLIASIVSDSEAGFTWLATLMAPLGYLAYGFIAYVIYSWLYLRYTRRQAATADTIVVLGSGLIHGRVPPLLASRLDRAQTVYDRSAANDHDPVMIVSGGQGFDEPTSEAQAMATYLESHGVASDQIWQENLSHTTDENIANTSALLDTRHRTGTIITVTNNFHAFRAALLMRRHKLPGHVIAAPTANYYWPSATIREYVAILRDHKPLTITMLTLTSIPLLAMILSFLLS